VRRSERCGHDVGLRACIPVPEPRRVAFEETFTTIDILRANRALVPEPSSLAQGDTEHLASRLTELGVSRIRSMIERGIDRQALLLAPPGVTPFDRDTALALAQDANDIAIQAVRGHPDRFFALAVLPPQVPNLAAEMLERCVANGMVGGLIGPDERASAKLWPVFEVASSLNVPLYLQSRGASCS
jgi:hypothetical protein